MDQTEKKDAGKVRMDLLPFGEFGTDDTLDEAYLALQQWWARATEHLLVCVPRAALPGVAAVLTFGAAKYEPRGWEKGIAFSRVFAAAARHAEAHRRGELTDPESGLPHADHFWCNVVFIETFETRGRTDLDDRLRLDS